MTGDPGDLLAAIRGGANLKPTETVDKSGPMVETPVNQSGDGNSFAAQAARMKRQLKKRKSPKSRAQKPKANMAVVNKIRPTVNRLKKQLGINNISDEANKAKLRAALTEHYQDDENVTALEIEAAIQPAQRQSVKKKSKSVVPSGAVAQYIKTGMMRFYRDNKGLADEELLDQLMENRSIKSKDYSREVVARALAEVKVDVAEAEEAARAAAEEKALREEEERKRKEEEAAQRAAEGDTDDDDDDPYAKLTFKQRLALVGRGLNKDDDPSKSGSGIEVGSLDLSGFSLTGSSAPTKSDVIGEMRSAEVVPGAAPPPPPPPGMGVPGGLPAPPPPPVATQQKSVKKKKKKKPSKQQVVPASTLTSPATPGAGSSVTSPPTSSSKPKGALVPKSTSVPTSVATPKAMGVSHAGEINRLLRLLQDISNS